MIHYDGGTTLRKGIYKIVDTYLDKTLSIGASEDLDQVIDNMSVGITPSGHCERYRFKNNLKIEVIEETEQLAERYAFYAWPHIKRLKYNDACISKSLNHKYSKQIKRVVNWLVDTFADSKYSFELADTDEILTATIFENGEPFEMYTFTKSGKPASRKYIKRD